SGQEVTKFEWRGSRGSLEYSDRDELLRLPGSEFVYGIIESKRWRYVNEATGRVNARTFPDVDNRAQTAAELAIRFAELGPVLVFCSRRNWVASVCKALYDRLALQKLAGVEERSIFSEPLGSAAIPVA